MLAVQVATLAEPTVAFARARSGASGGQPATSMASGTRSVTASYLASETSAFKSGAQTFREAWSVSPPCGEREHARLPVAAILTPIVTPYGPLWIESSPLYAAESAEAGKSYVDAAPASSHVSAAVLAAAPGTSVPAAPTAASPSSAGRVSANSAPTPEKERDEEAIATQSATASTTLAVSNPEAAGAVTYRKPRTSLWAWAGSAALVGLFVAGVSNDLSKDKGPPPEPQPLPDFPDAP